MRDKTKANLSGQLKPETLEKLKQISADKKLSQIKTVEWLIDNYKDQVCKNKIQGVVFLPHKPTPQKRFNLAEELAKLKEK